MTEINVGDSQTYLLSLESIDLTYLSKYIKNPSEKTRVLWSNKSLSGESEYYQVEIAAQDFSEEDCYFESSDTYTCHLCNSAVPIICLKEHNESKTHEIYKKLCENILQRYSNQIKMRNFNNEEEITNDIYYCEPCFKAVQLKNKYKHELTDYHKRSVDILKLLNGFYMACIENDFDKESVFFDDSNADSNTDNSDPEETESDVENPNLDNKLQEISTDCLNAISECDKQTDQKIKTDKSNSNLELKNDGTEKELDFRSYLKDMIDKYNLCVRQPVADSDFIHIETPMGEKRKVSRINFHSYREIKNSIYCQVCKVWNSQDTKNHDVNENHVRNIFKPINEMFARTIDNVSSHCLICNEVILTQSDHHRINENHKKLLNETKVYKTEKNDKSLCEICNIYFFDNQNYIVHLNSGEHKFNKTAKLYTNNNNYIVREVNSKIDNGEHDVHNLDFCDICKTSVPRHEMWAHISENTSQVFTNFKRDKTSNGEITGTSLTNCSNQIGKYTVENKKSSKDEYIRLIDEKKNIVKCAACDVSLTNSEKNITGHMEGKNHLRIINKDKIRSYHKLLKYTDETKTKAKCSICDVDIALKDNKIISHMESTDHEEIVNKDKILAYCKFLERSAACNASAGCRICDITFPYIAKNVIRHIESAEHFENQLQLLQFHRIRTHPRGFFCDCCSILICSFFDHINSERHINMFQINTKIDKTLLKKYVYGGDIHCREAIQYRELYRNLMVTNKINKLDDFSFYCGLCCVCLRVTCEIDHVLSDRHMVIKQNARTYISNVTPVFSDGVGSNWLMFRSAPMTF